MIKTDKVVYRARTLEEYDWLMEKLDEAGCEWLGGGNPTGDDIDWASDMVGSYIWVNHRIISYSETKYQLNSLNDVNFIDCEYIKVSDLMKKDVTTENLDELEVIYKQVTSQIEDLRKQGKEPKAIEYTIKVCFE